MQLTYGHLDAFWLSSILVILCFLVQTKINKCLCSCNSLVSHHMLCFKLHKEERNSSLKNINVKSHKRKENRELSGHWHLVRYLETVTTNLLTWLLNVYNGILKKELHQDKPCYINGLLMDFRLISEINIFNRLLES